MCLSQAFTSNLRCSKSLHPGQASFASVLSAAHSRRSHSVAARTPVPFAGQRAGGRCGWGTVARGVPAAGCPLGEACWRQRVTAKVRHLSIPWSPLVAMTVLGQRRCQVHWCSCHEKDAKLHAPHASQAATHPSKSSAPTTSPHCPERVRLQLSPTAVRSRAHRSHRPYAASIRRGAGPTAHGEQAQAEACRATQLSAVPEAIQKLRSETRWAIRSRYCRWTFHSLTCGGEGCVSLWVGGGGSGGGGNGGEWVGVGGEKVGLLITRLGI